MNVTPTLIYWITRLDPICKAGSAMAMFGLAIGLLLFGPLCDDIGKEVAAKLKRIQKWLFAMGVAGLLIVIFVPTEKEAAAIIVIPRIANSETVEQIGDGMKTLAVEWLEELRPNKGDKTK